MRAFVIYSLLIQKKKKKKKKEKISNATFFNFKYFSSDISYQAYFSYVVSEVMKLAFVGKSFLNSCHVTSYDEISWN